MVQFQYNRTKHLKKVHIIAFVNRVFQPAERYYSVEILVLVWALQHFRGITKGYKITVYTVHTPITKIVTDKNVAGQLAQWYLTVKPFNRVVKYLTGKSNVVADALSRNIPIRALPGTDATMHPLRHTQVALIYCLRPGKCTTGNATTRM